MSREKVRKKRERLKKRDGARARERDWTNKRKIVRDVLKKGKGKAKRENTKDKERQRVKSVQEGKMMTKTQNTHKKKRRRNEKVRMRDNDGRDTG